MGGQVSRQKSEVLTNTEMFVSKIRKNNRVKRQSSKREIVYQHALQ